MSFILDALRKSDAERQRSATPGLADVRYRPRQVRREIWLPVLVVVLAVNILVMVFLWLRPSPPAVVVPPPATAPAGGLVANPALPEVRPLAQEADLEPAEPPGPAPEPNVVLEVTELPGTDPMAPVPPATSLAPASPPAMAGAAGTAPVPPATGMELPSAEELIAIGSLKSPPLNLDLHVYSATPGSRFVVINSRRYPEGARIQEGPTVETITPDGVILDNQGSRFILRK